ncbi:PEP-utilizing enzyme [Amycolatopsis rhabdoformis]|uniref:PEP-utilizing enzyme n=1 Tax=Amycolatopsis rhabdoformis TaxID=1448059 RepID=A0ABZ1IFV9_9PSEU|nr:PEP-utilizing enzyme [Amycolatopsis rhabdoformis]WSE32573.1 PEP-utilizing enzyme [Amycolatopsis rhabdoformis]
MTTEPVTSSAPERDDELCTWPDRPILFTRANAIDQWPRPVTPLTQDLIALPQERSLDRAFSRDLGTSPSLPEWSWNAVFYGWVTYSVEAAATMADNIPGYSRRSVYSDYFGVGPDPDVEESGGGAGPLEVAKIGLNFVRSMRSYPQRGRRDIERYRMLLDEDLARDWAAVPDAELRRRVAEHPGEAAEAKVPQVLSNVIAAPLFQSFTAAVEKFGGEEAPGLITQSLSALGGIHLSDASAAMRRVHAGELSLADFNREYGFRGPNEFELSVAPWRDDPERLAKLIAAVATQGSPDSTEARDAARARLKTLAGVRWPYVRFLLKQVEQHMRWRENGKIAPAMATHSMRLIVREAARRFVAAGVLEDTEDVYFLRHTELLGLLDGDRPAGLRERIARRKAAHTHAENNPLPEMMDVRPGAVGEITADRWRSLGMLPPESDEGHAGRLVGVGGAPGVATGRARIVADPYEVDIEDGDILVAAGTDSAWTPLFYQAAGVVVDIGGPMSHAAIAAREVGIPCVLNVKTGTCGSLAEGQTITIDGAAGTVTLG